MTNPLRVMLDRSARFRALLHKEMLTTLKDRTSRMILVGPLILYVILFGYVATFNLDYAPYALLDMSKTRQSAELIRAVDQSAVFDRVMTLQNTAQIAPAIDSGKALVVMVIGQDYAENLAEGKPAQVQVIIDGRNSTTAQLAAGYLSIIAGNVSGAGTVFESIRYLYNPNNLTQWFILPALIMMLSMLQIMVLSALSVARERDTAERGTVFLNIAAHLSSSQNEKAMRFCIARPFNIAILPYPADAKRCCCPPAR